LEIKYSKKKEDLRKDPVMDGLMAGRKYLSENANTLLSVGIAVLLVFGGFAAYTRVKQSGQRKAQDALGKAMIMYEERKEAEAVEAFSLLADEHRRTPQAAYAAFMLGHLYLGRGNIDEAVSWFEVAASHKHAGFVSGEALEGIADCYDAKDDLDKSLDYLKKALKNKNYTYRYPALRWKTALLCQRTGKYDDARQYCKDLLADTTATEFRQRARNLLVEVDAL
jgi:hypothetical protein